MAHGTARRQRDGHAVIDAMVVGRIRRRLVAAAWRRSAERCGEGLAATSLACCWAYDHRPSFSLWSTGWLPQERSLRRGFSCWRAALCATGVAWKGGEEREREGGGGRGRGGRRKAWGDVSKALRLWSMRRRFYASQSKRPLLRHDWCSVPAGRWITERADC